MKTKQLTPEARKFVEEFSSVREDRKALEKREEDLKQKILHYADHEEAALRFNAELLCTVEFKAGRTKCDIKALQVKFPAAAAEVVSKGDPYLQIETHCGKPVIPTFS